MSETGPEGSGGEDAPSLLHDLSNVVLGAQRLAELALNQLEPGHPARKDISAILGSCLQGTALVSRLLGAKAPSGAELELNSLVATVIARFQGTHGRRVDLRFKAAGERLRVRMDTTDFQRVLDNLILNAVAALDGGGVVVLRLTRENDRALLQVSDNGRGMDAATRARIFEPDFTTKRGAGHGLGLSVVRRLVEATGGTVGVESAEGQGATFSIHLPLAKREAPAATRTILLVDDHAAVRSSIGQVLRESGCRVLEAADAAGALRMLDGAVDVLLTDLKLPDMEGTELADEARARTPGLKVVYMSGYTWADVPESDAALLVKPTPPDQLRDTIAGLFGQ